MISRLVFVAATLALSYAIARSRWYHRLTNRREIRRRLRNL